MTLSKSSRFFALAVCLCISFCIPVDRVWSAQPNRLVFTIEPVNGSAGDILAPVAVSVETQQGVLVTSDNTTQVRLTLPALTATLSGTTTQTVVNGVATFSDLSIDAPGTGYTLLADSVNVGPPPLDQGISTPFDISAGAPAQLAFVQQPSDVLAGEDISPAVTVAVQDMSGNTVTTDSGTLVTMSIALCGNPVTLEAETDSSGVATFPLLRLNTVAPGVVLDASAAGLAGAVSASFNVLDNMDRIFFDGFEDPACTP